MQSDVHLFPKYAEASSGDLLCVPIHHILASRSTGSRVIICNQGLRHEEVRVVQRAYIRDL